MSREAEARLYEITAEVLELARVEVVRRMNAARLPLSSVRQELVVQDLDSGAGWNSDVTDVRFSGLRGLPTLIVIGDRSVPTLALGLREQLTPLAEYLAENSDLASRRYGWALGRSETEIDTLLRLCVNPLAIHYLKSISDLGAGDIKLVGRLTAELQEIASSWVIQRTQHLAIGGITPSGLYTEREVSIRPLTPGERGAWLEQYSQLFQDQFMPGSDFSPYAPLPHHVPTALLEVTTEQPLSKQFNYIENSRLPYKIALSLFLCGFDLSASGHLTSFDRPVWASPGRSHKPFPVLDKIGVTGKQISADQFRDVVNFAYGIPDFDPNESGRQEVALYRTLRGCGAQSNESGFLDFAIALEAALLSGATSELSYRFSLYGALFLRNDFKPVETFKRFKDIYTARSKLVHGGTLRREIRIKAERDAPELAKAVIRKAVISGWPDSRHLDLVAVVSGGALGHEGAP